MCDDRNVDDTCDLVSTHLAVRLTLYEYVINFEGCFYFYKIALVYNIADVGANQFDIPFFFMFTLSPSVGSHFAPRLDKSVMTLRPFQMGQNNFTFLAAQISTLIVMMVSPSSIRRPWAASFLSLFPPRFSSIVRVIVEQTQLVRLMAVRDGKTSRNEEEAEHVKRKVRRMDVRREGEFLPTKLTRQVTLSLVAFLLPPSLRKSAAVRHCRFVK